LRGGDGGGESLSRHFGLRLGIEVLGGLGNFSGTYLSLVHCRKCGLQHRFCRRSTVPREWQTE
jgi:hypothetical protein